MLFLPGLFSSLFAVSIAFTVRAAEGNPCKDNCLPPSPQLSKPSIPPSTHVWGRRGEGELITSATEECMLATDAQVQALPGYEAALDRVQVAYGGRRPTKAYANDSRWPQYQLFMCRSRTPVKCDYSMGEDGLNCPFYDAVSRNVVVPSSGNLNVPFTVDRLQTTSTTVEGYTPTQNYDWLRGPVLQFVGGPELLYTSTLIPSVLTAPGSDYVTRDAKPASYTIAQKAKPNQHCVASYFFRSCHAEYKGESRAYLKGYVHYQFDRAVTYIGGTKKGQTWMRDVGQDWEPDGASTVFGLKTVVKFDEVLFEQVSKCS